MTVEVTRRADKQPKIATFMGTKFATSTQLSHTILEMFRQPDWPELPSATCEWLHLQRKVSKLPEADRMLMETFGHEDRQYLVCYGFAGRNAQQTLGLLLSQRMELAGLAPIGFVATDYATMLWGLEEVRDPAALVRPDGLRDSFEQWLSGNAVMKRTFRAAAIIAGLIDRNTPGRRKTGRQATFSSDILYDTLLKYDPDHVLMQITREEARRGLVDFGRIEELLARTTGRVDHRRLDRISPLAAPLLLERGTVPVAGAAEDRLLAQAAEALMQEAGLPA